jgi:hypothetical protein
MIKMEVYMTPAALIAFKKGEKVTVTPYCETDDVRLWIALEDVVVSDATDTAFDIQKYSHSGPITR